MRNSGLILILASLRMAAANLMITASNLVRDISIARSLGVSASVDAFFLALSIPIFLATVFGGAFRTAILPLLETAEKTNSLRYSSGFVGFSVRRATVFLFFVSVIAGTLVTYFSPILFRNSSPTIIELIPLYTWAALPMLFLSTTGAFFDGPLFSRGTFFFTTSTKILMPLGLAVGALTLGNSHGALGAILIGTIGALVQLILVLSLARLRGAIAALSPSANYPEYLQLKKQLGFLFLGTAIAYINPVIDQVIAAQLGDKAVSTLSFANRLSTGLASLTTGALSPVLLSHFSKHLAAGNTETVRTLYRNALHLGSWLGTLLTILVFLFSDPLVGVLYESRQFDHHDVLAVGHILAVLGIQFIPFLISTSAFTLLSAARLNHYFVPLGAIIFFVNLISDIALMKSFGLSGIALSTGITYLISLLVMTSILLRRGLISLGFKDLFQVVFAASSGAAVCYLAAYFRLKPDSYAGIADLIAPFALTIAFAIGAFAANYRLLRPLFAR